MRSDYLRIAWLGVMILIVSGLPSVFFLTTVPHSATSLVSSLLPQKSSEFFPPKILVNLPLSNDFSALSVGNARSQISFSVDPPRPDSNLKVSRLMIRLAQSKQVKRVELPARIDLQFSQDQLSFTEKASRFWMICSSETEGAISACLSYETPEGEIVSNATWISSPQETPIQSVEEFPIGTPFRELGESKWCGQDVFLEKYIGGDAVHRMEIGSPSKMELMDFSLKDWLVFKDKKWQKVNSLDGMEHLPIARLKNASSLGLEIEGWEGMSHIRMKLPFPSLAPLKMRGEELFTQLRVRSEKQVSCMLDKQCLILRPNDWALKSQGRWKILRKKEDRIAFLDGKLSGELFVLDRIEAKGAIKSISGHYFSSGRSQVVPIEYVQKSSVQKGIGKKR